MTPTVSVIFVTYRRFHLLRRTVESFLQHTAYPNLELIVSDDGSPREVQEQISSLPVHKVLLSKKRRGFAGNANTGLRESSGEYILMLQDDWECHGPRQYLADAVAALQRYPHLGILKFYGRNATENSVREIDDQMGIFEIERPISITETNRHIYSDTPHIRSRGCLAALGEYNVSLPMEECEREYEYRFLKQERFAAAYISSYMNSVFIHTGEAESFRTNSKRAKFEKRLRFLVDPMRCRAAPLYQMLRLCYRIGARSLYRAGALR
jgi:glycosyltransferase involved in cell wall biosynthesis